MDPHARAVRGILSQQIAAVRNGRTAHRNGVVVHQTNHHILLGIQRDALTKLVAIGIDDVFVPLDLPGGVALYEQHMTTRVGEGIGLGGL